MSDSWDKDFFSAGLLEPGFCRNEEAQLAISCYLDGEAEAAERKLAELHLADCFYCQNMFNKWKQAARTLGSTTFTEGPAYQAQADVRFYLAPRLSKARGKLFQNLGFPAPSRKLTRGFLAFSMVVGFTVLLGRYTLSNPAIFNSASNAVINLASGNTATATAPSTLMFSPMNTTFSLNTSASVQLVLPLSLDNALKNATTVRYFPAPPGKFNGFTAVVGWFQDDRNRLWLVDPVKGEIEVDLANLGLQNEVIRFIPEEQVVFWSERGALVSFHSSGSKIPGLGLVSIQEGRVMADQLVQPATATVMARVIASPVPKP